MDLAEGIDVFTGQPSKTGIVGLEITSWTPRIYFPIVVGLTLVAPQAHLPGQNTSDFFFVFSCRPNYFLRLSSCLFLLLIPVVVTQIRGHNHEGGILTFNSNQTKKNEFDQKSFGTSFALRVIQLWQCVQLDVACS